MAESCVAGPAALLRLATWLSPAFPVGGFAWSHGLESAVAEGRVRDEDALFDWISCFLQFGSGWNDLVLFAASHRAAADPERIAELAELGHALAGSRERRAETGELGAAFAAAARPWEDVAPAPYPIAVAVAAARSEIPLALALVAYANAFASNLVSAAVRLVPLGQSKATAVLRRLEPAILEASAKAAGSSLDDLGSAAFLSDIAALRHETLTTRLFRS